MVNSVDNPISYLNQAAAMLLAAAVVELFPDTLMISGQGTGKYFYHDFVFPFEFNSEFLPMIEERMRLIIREKRSVRSFEMMPSNAAVLMLHSKQKIVADQLSQLHQMTVPMVQIGDFTSFGPQPPIKSLFIPHLKILEGYAIEGGDGVCGGNLTCKPSSRSLPSLSEAAGKKIIRIVGASAQDKETLKEISKQPPVSLQSHIKLAKESDLCKPMEDDGMWFWCPKGERLRQHWMQWWRDECTNEKFNLISSPVSCAGKGNEEEILRAHRDYFLRYGGSKVAEIAWICNEDFTHPTLGLLSPKIFFGDRIHLFCPDEKLLEECISSLRFILKIPKILGFEFEIVLSISSEVAQKAKARRSDVLKQALEKTGLNYSIEKKYRAGSIANIDVCLVDALGRRWTGPFLRMPEIAMPIGKGSVLELSAFGSLERMCALLLEKVGGWIPLKFAPEQVRILVANDKANSYANEVYEALAAQGVRVTVESSEEKLKSQLYRAIVERVPYILLLGEQEMQARSLTIRANGESKAQILSLDEFCMRLKREMESGNSEFKN